MTHVIKRVASLLILAALFLPLSQCSSKEVAPDTHAVVQTTTVTYAYTAENWPSMGAVATYAAFVWPIVFTVACFFIRGARRHRFVIGSMEMLLCVGSACMLFTFLVFQTPLIGWWVASLSLATYFIATTAELFGHVRSRLAHARDTIP